MNAVFVPVETRPDVQRVEALARKIWPVHYTPIIGKEQVEYMLNSYHSAEIIQKEVQSGLFYYIIRGEDGIDAGYCAFELRKDELYLSKLYLLPASRGKGFGRQAVLLAEETARQAGVNKITLNVNKRNPAVEVYKKLGFKVEREMIKDIGNGFVMDDYIMEKAVI